MRSVPLRWTIAVLLAARLLSTSIVLGAEPQPYEVTLKPTGDATLDGVLHDTSSLISLREGVPVGPFALVGRAQDDAGRFIAALHSFGYYKARIIITVDGHPLDDPGLFELLDQAPSSPAVPVVVGFDLGPQFHIGRVTIDGTMPPDVAAQQDLPSGAPATAASVLAAQARLLNVLRDAGYALAKVDLPPATLRTGENLLDVEFQVSSGPSVDIGPIALTGLQHMNEDFVRRRLLLHRGERFNPDAIEKVRQDLASLGVFSVVRAQPADHVDADGQLPITFDVTERPSHSVEVGAAYSTDLGVNLNAGWHDRNLFGNAEQLNLTGSIQLGGNAVQKPGYLPRRAARDYGRALIENQILEEPEPKRDGPRHLKAAHPAVAGEMINATVVARRQFKQRPARRDHIQGRADLVAWHGDAASLLERPDHAR